MIVANMIVIGFVLVVIWIIIQIIDDPPNNFAEVEATVVARKLLTSQPTKLAGVYQYTQSTIIKIGNRNYEVDEDNFHNSGARVGDKVIACVRIGKLIPRIIRIIYVSYKRI